MARRNTQTSEAPAPAGLTLAARPSATGVRRASRTVEFDPAFAQVEADLLSTLEVGALQYEVSTEDDVKKVKSLLSRARTKHDTADAPLGLTQSVSASGTGTFLVDFEANRNKRQRTYTAKEIKDWAVENGHEVITGKIPQTVRDAFRESRGLKVKAKVEAASDA